MKVVLGLLLYAVLLALGRRMHRLAMARGWVDAGFYALWMLAAASAAVLVRLLS